MKKRKTSITHDVAMRKELRANPKFAVEYLKAALEVGDSSLLRLALRRVAEANRDPIEVAKAAGIQRESI